MAVDFSTSKTISERVKQGFASRSTDDGGIIPFNELWDPETLTSTHRPGGANAIFRHLNDGYKVEVLHLYRDELRQIISAVVRLEHPDKNKITLPIRATAPFPSPRWETRALDAPRPLYGLDLLAARPLASVLVVEGEKTADAGRVLFPDRVVVTWSGGTSGVGAADLRPLADRDITIWPDNDVAGRAAAEKLGELLATVGVAGLRVVMVPEQFPAKWDVADPLPGVPHADGTRCLQRLLADAVPMDVFAKAREPERARPSGEKSQAESATSDHGYLAEVTEGVEVLTFLIAEGKLDFGEYAAWSRAGIALKNSYGEEGFAPWLAFSQEADKFDSDESCRKVWDAIRLREEGDRLTIATYIAQAKELGWKSSRPPKRSGNGNGSGGGGGTGSSGAAEGGPGKNVDPAAYVLDLVSDAGDELWVDREGKPHVSYAATLPDGEKIMRHAPIDGGQYKNVLKTRFYEAAQTKTLKNDQADSAVGILGFRAAETGQKHIAALRVAEHEGRIYVDLGTPDGKAVAIGFDNWEVVADVPVRFVRGSRGELPIPESGGTRADFERHFNLSPDDLTRLIGFLVGTFNVGGSYALLMADGHQGSGKSTMLDKAVGLVDPPFQAKSARMSFNPKEQDLHIGALGVHVPYFDNVSTFSADAADALCRMSTGGGSGSRKLYTDDQYSRLTVMRPIMLTCIGAPSSRPDLLDRSVRITALPLEAHRTERAVMRAFDADRPKMLGFLFSCVAAALRNRAAVDEAVELGVFRLPRMADFACFVEGAGELLGLELGGFSALLSEGQSAMQVEAAAGDPVGAALIRYFSNANASVMNAPAREILESIQNHGSNERIKWPAANVFAKTLKRLAVGLGYLGIEFEISEPQGRANVQRYKIWTTAAFEPQSRTSRDDLGDGGGQF